MSSKLEKIYVVFKTHFDIGFTGLVSDVVYRYRNDMLDGVIDICEKTSANAEHEKYVWTMSAWPLKQSLEGSTPENHQKALEILGNEQLVWHLLPYTTHTEFCGLEEWIRGMYISRELSEQYGYYPKDAKMTDVPGHTWIVPSLLKKAGVKFLHLGCNPASTPPDVPDIFWWEGPDGERLLTYYSKGQYGTGILPPEEWEHPVWLAMIQTGDNHGAHHPSIIAEMKQQIIASGSNAELHIGSLQDFAEDFLYRNPELPVIRGDLADAWIHGVGTAPREVSRVRKLRGEVSSTESALTMLASKQLVEDGEVRSMKQDIAKSYEHTLHFGEHTWGMDCKTFLFPRRYEKSEFLEDKETDRYKLMESSWQEQREYLNTAEAAIQAVQASLQKQLQGDSGSEEQAQQLLVFNHLGWKRDVIVERDEEAHAYYEDAHTGELVQVRERQSKRQLLVKDVPALGYKLIRSVPQPAAEVAAFESFSLDVIDHGDVLTVENRYMSIRVAKQDGAIISFWDKELQHEFVDTSSAYRFGQYEYNIYSNQEITRYLKKYGYRFYDWGIYDFGKIDYPEGQKRLSYVPKQAQVRVERGEQQITITSVSQGDPDSIVKYGNARELSWSLTMYADKHEIDFSFHMKDKQQTPLAESGSIIFPLNIGKPSYRMNKLGAVLDPVTDVVRGASTLLNCCEAFIDTTNQEQTVGMAILPMDSPLFFIGKNGMWDYEQAYQPDKPELHFNLYNNWWGTNFPQWVGGELSYAFKLIPHKGSWSEASLWKTAEEARTQAFCMPYAVQEQQTLYSLIVEDLDRAAITSFKLAEDGKGYIIRIRDWSGERRRLVIKLADIVKQAALADLLEYDQEQLTVSYNQGAAIVELDSLPFDVHTLRIQL